MDCLRWLGEKLVTHIDVFELEELLLKPFLNSVLDYLEEIIKASEETTQQNTLLLTKILINILQQSIKGVNYCAIEPECGIGELPSLPQVVPKILMSSFSFLLKFKPSKE